LQKQHKLQIAAKHLSSLIAAYRNQNISKLPSVRTIAKEAGVSYGIMWDALQQKIAQRDLIAIEGRGTFIRSLYSAHNTSEPRGNRLRKKTITAALLHDAQSQTFGQQAILPPIKDLQRRYMVGYRTIRSVIDDLLQHAIIEPAGRSYRLCKPTVSAAGASLLFICLGETSRPFFHLPGSAEWHYESYKQIDEYSRMRNVRLMCFTFDHHNAKVCDFLGNPAVIDRNVIARHNVLGIVFSLNSMLDTPAFRQFIHHLQSLNLPISYVNQDENISLQSLTTATARVFSSGSSYQAGKTMATFLLHRGYSKAVYVTVYHNQPWSVSRLRGVSSAFEQFAHNTTLHAVTLGIENIEQKNLDLDAMAFERISPLLEPSQEHSGLYQTALQKLYAHFEKEIHTLTRVSLHESLLQQACTRALEYDAEVWICANDLVAAFAQQFLQRAGKSISPEISLVGFDNCLNAFADELTSYDFNIQAMVRSAIDYCINPNHVLKSAPANGVIAGEIVPRASLKPPAPGI